MAMARLVLGMLARGINLSQQQGGSEATTAGAGMVLAPNPNQQQRGGDLATDGAGIAS